MKRVPSQIATRSESLPEWFWLRFELIFIFAYSELSFPWFSKYLIFLSLMVIGEHTLLVVWGCSWASLVCLILPALPFDFIDIIFYSWCKYAINAIKIFRFGAGHRLLSCSSSFFFKLFFFFFFSETWVSCPNAGGRKADIHLGGSVYLTI